MVRSTSRRGSVRSYTTPRGLVRWEARAYGGRDANGKERRVARGGFASKREAEKALTALFAELDRGLLVDHSARTVADLLRWWLDTSIVPQRRPRTVTLYRDSIDRYLIPSLGHHQVQKLSGAHVKTFLVEMQKQGVGSWQIRECYKRLSQALKEAERLELVPRNVCALVDVPRHEERELQTWDQAQARRFLRSAGASAYGPVWPLALATGLRRGELLGLRWADVDLDRGTLQVRQAAVRVDVGLTMGPPKRVKSKRPAVLQPQIVQALRAHHAGQLAARVQAGAHWRDYGLVFCTEVGTPINPSNLRRDFIRLCERAGVPPIRIHDARHTFATLSIAAGADYKAVAEALGHADPALTIRRYQHVLDQQRQDVAAKVGASLFGPAEEDRGIARGMAPADDESPVRHKERSP